MAGRTSRSKGSRGELEVRDILRKHGFECLRGARYESDLVHSIDGFHFEVKRRETLDLPGWTRQAEKDAGERVPVVVYRKTREPWRVSLPLEALLELLSIEKSAKQLACFAVTSPTFYVVLDQLLNQLKGDPHEAL